MAEQGECSADACRGIAVAEDRCIVHCSEEGQDKVIAELADGRQFDVFRATVVPPGLFRRAMEALPSAGSQHPVVVRPDFTGAKFGFAPRFDQKRCAGYACFSGTEFANGARFGRTHFAGGVSFEGATFGGEARFGDTEFDGPVMFSRAVFTASSRFANARFRAPAVFKAAKFGGHSDFDRAHFDRSAAFQDAEFNERCVFSGVRFGGSVRFQQARFDRSVVFRDAEFAEDARFEGVRFGGSVRFNGSHVAGDIRLSDATWSDRVTLGPLRVAGAVCVDRSTFEQNCALRIAQAGTVRLDHSRFERGLRLQVDSGDIYGIGVELGAPSRIMPLTLAPDGEGPRLITLTGTDLSCLSVGHVDLSVCGFLGAHQVDQFRVEDDEAFGYTPDSLWLSRRRITGDERRWRAFHGAPRRRRRWSLPADWPRVGNPVSAGDVARSYRALRKTTEDAKDAPGAADFYYGEMEMRRCAKRAELTPDWRRPAAFLGAASEYLLLWLYWLVAGYGLRASRALIALAVVFVVAGAVLSGWGFVEPHGFGSAIRFALGTSVSVFRPVEARLTPTGEWAELVVRVLGPLLVGLVLLSLRGRVKR